MSKANDSGAAGGLPLLEGFVWVCFAVAAAATLYVLMQEPEDGTPPLWDLPLARYRVAALGASALAGLAGLGRLVARGGGPGLFGMAVVLNVILACFWALRFLLAP